MGDSIRVKRIGAQLNIALITIWGSLDMLLANQFRDTGNALIQDGIYKFIIDLNDLEYISSAGIEILCAMAQKLERNDGKIILLNVSEKTYKLFEMLGMTKVFPVKDAIEEAIEELELHDQDCSN